MNDQHSPYVEEIDPTTGKTFVVCDQCGHTDYLHDQDCRYMAALTLAERVNQATSIITRIGLLNDPNVPIEIRVWASLLVGPR